MEKRLVYAYRGENKSLKSIGYEFQKLYAANYKAYHKDDIFMFVRSGMVIEINNTTVAQQVAIIDLIVENIDKPDSFWERDSHDIMSGEPCKDDVHLVTKIGNIYDWNDFFDIAREAKRPLEDAFHSKCDLDENCEKELKALRACEFYDDPFVITLKFVNQIKDLYRLGICKVEMD